MSGVFLAGAVLHAFRARRSESPRVHWLLAVLCALPVPFLLLQVLEFDAATPGATGTVRRIQCVVACTFLVVYPYFLALVTHVRGRWMPRLIALTAVLMAAKGVTSPTGLWLRTIDEVHPVTMPWGEGIQRASGQPSAWMLVTLLTWVALTAYGIACALHYRRRPDAVGARALMVFHGFFLVAMIHDLLLAAGFFTSIPLSIFSAPILVGGMWWRTAVEDRRRVDALRDLYGSAADAILVMDAATGAIREVNRSACRVLGRERAELTGVALDTAIAPADRRLLEQTMARVARERGAEPAMIEVSCRRSAGADFPAQILLRFAVLEAQDSIVASLRDVTELATAEAERKRLELQMQHAQRLESLGVLAGGIAHDFNNILTAILGRLSLLEGRVKGDRSTAHLAEAELAVKRAADLCRQMLVYAGKGRAQIGPIDLSRLVDEMGRMLEVSVGKQVELRRELAVDLPPIEGDASQLRQVVMNLITNAAEAIGTRPGHVVLRTRQIAGQDLPTARFVTGPPAGASAYLLIEVADDGSGMDETTRHRMFDPFFTTKFTGRGLGMSAILGILRDHHGALTVESEPGLGTTVGVYLPAIAEVAAPAAPTPELVRGGEMRALVADDDDAVRVLTVGMLERLGFEPIAVPSGVGCIEACAKDDRIGLAIIDVNMPGMDGLTTLAAIRAHRAELPVILITGESLATAETAAAALERVTVLPKPYDLAALSQAIERTRLPVGA
jgi:PAS domain S-box-containing protein